MTVKRIILLAPLMAMAWMATPVMGANYYWTNGDGDSLWSNPNNWKTGVKPPSNAVDNVYFGNDCPDEPQEIILDESVWTRALFFTASGNRHYTITPASDETVWLGYLYGLNGNDNRTVDVTVNADILIPDDYLRVSTYGGLTTLNGTLKAAPSRDTGSYLSTENKNGWLRLGGSNDIIEIRCNANMIFNNRFATYSVGYIRSSSDEFLLQTDRVEFGRFWADGNPLKLGVHDDLKGENVTAVLKSGTEGKMFTISSGYEEGGTLELLVTGGMLVSPLDLDAGTILHLTNSTSWSSTAYPQAGWVVGDGRVVIDGSVAVASTNAYTGGTYVNSGTLTLSGDDRLPTNGAVTVAADATLYLASRNQRLGELHGAGTVRFTWRSTNDPITNRVDHLLSPGVDGFGKLTFSNSGRLLLTETTVSRFELGAPGEPADQVAFANTKGEVTLAGTLEVRDLGGMDTGDYTLFTLNGGAVEGAFDNVILPRYITGTVEIIGGDVVLRAVRHRGTAIVVR